jgi:hypothetical protein
MLQLAWFLVSSGYAEVESHVDRRDENRWLKIAWNYKPQGKELEEDQEGTGKSILRPVQALKCIICEENKKS